MIKANIDRKIRTFIDKIALNVGTYHDEAFYPTLINFMYGGNGSGKSTIARRIQEKKGLSWETPRSSDISVMLFNEDYIRNNIVSYGNIPAVFSLTEENAEIHKQLERKRQEKQELDILLQKEEKITAELRARKSFLDNKYSNAVWKKTERWRKSDFPKTQTGYGSNKNKMRFFSELRNRVPVEGDKEELLNLYNTVFTSTMPDYKYFVSINAYRLPNSAIIMKPLISRSNNDFVQFIHALGNLDWIKHGSEHYLREDICPFCQSKIDRKKLIENIEACFDEQYKEDYAELQRFVQQYTDAYKNICDIIECNRKNPFPVSEFQKKNYEHQVEMFYEKGKANIRFLEKKLTEPSSIINNEFEDLSLCIQEISNITDEINASISKYMELIATPKKEEAISQKVWSFMAYECRYIIEDYETNMQIWNADKIKNDDAIASINEKLSKLQLEVDNLSSYTANTTYVMESINATLKAIGFNGFYLKEKADASYMYELVRNTDNSEIVANDLSEGERNFIAFLYFYHTVIGSQSKDGRINDKIVVIDDPVSSMDHQTMFYVSALVRNLIEICFNNYKLEDTVDDCIKQFFCMTHNPIFFKEITYNKISEYECVSFFEITKDIDNHSHIEELTEETDDIGGNKVNKSPVHNYYETLWHVFRTTDRKEILIAMAHQILEYHFIQNEGYEVEDFRRLVLDGENKSEFLRRSPKGKTDETYYNIAVSMISLLDVGISNYNDGLFFDSSLYNIAQMRKAFRIIFEVTGRMHHYNLMMKKKL